MPSDPHGPMTDQEINEFLSDGSLCLLAFGHNCKGRVSMCSPAFHHVFVAKVRALLRREGERLIDRFHPDKTPFSYGECSTIEAIIRRLMEVSE